jgi:hypothetical protein
VRLQQGPMGLLQMFHENLVAPLLIGKGGSAITVE